MNRLLLWTALSLSSLCIAAPSVRAATLIVGADGKLTGATGVTVGASTFDVRFIDGTCAAVFDGCDQLADFDFITEADGIAAATALLDQVFIDGQAGLFDTMPQQTLGCTATTCAAFIPISPGPTSLRVHIASNTSGGDGVFAGFVFPSADFAGAAGNVFARFTPTSAVPEPQTWAFMIVGFGAIGATLRSSRRKHSSKSCSQRRWRMISVEVPWARSLPSPESNRASAVAICRPCESTRPSQRTAGSSGRMARVMFALVSTVV